MQYKPQQLMAAPHKPFPMPQTVCCNKPQQLMAAPQQTLECGGSGGLGRPVKKRKKRLYFFVDDPNLWAEGQKVAAQKSNLKSDRDPRFRIDLGSMLRYTEKKLDGEICDPMLFGSKPPPNDTVWKAARERNFKVHIKDRGLEGNEKEVDAALITECVAMATSIYVRREIAARIDERCKSDEVEFVLVTGDRDMRPCIEKVLSYGIPVTVMAFDKSISRELRKMKGCDKYKVIKLDDDIDKFSFINFRSKYEPEVEVGNAIVVDLHEAFPKAVEAAMGEDGEKAPWDNRAKVELFKQLCGKMRETREIFYHGGVLKDRYVVVEFEQPPNDDLFSLMTNRIFKNGKAVRSYVIWEAETRAAVASSSDAVVDNYFDALKKERAEEDADERDEKDSGAGTSGGAIAQTCGSGTAAAPQSVGNENDGGAWLTKMGRSTAASRHKKQQRGACEFGIHCAKAGECGYKHTPEECNIFHRYAGSRHGKCDFRLWKSRQCTRPTQHDYKFCCFSHSEIGGDMRWCTFCKKDGYLSANCPCKRAE